MILIVKDQFIRYGISFGSALAISISYFHNQSIIWAIIHGFFGWIYVVYHALFKP